MMERDEKGAARPWNGGGRGWIVVLACLASFGCAGGIPSIPNSPDEIIAKADRYFQRGKFFSSQELFKAFLERHAGHDRSDYAQFMLAESYYNQEEYALAAIEYRVLVTNYGYSEFVDESFFKQALCSYSQSPKSQLDQTKAYEALSLFQQFTQVFKESPLVPEAEKHISLIHEKLARKELDNAEYYFRSKRYKSALIYLDKIIENYPGNVNWVRAKYLKAKVLFIRGERADEARELLRQVIDHTGDPELKRDADALMAQMEAGRNG
jgi:outer membrane assembly lipoprotein YfiO